MSLFFPKTITVIRETGYFAEGIWTKIDGLIDADEEMILDADGEDIEVSEPSGDTFTIKGSAQPLTGKDMDSIPVGRSDIGRIKIYTDTKLHVCVADTTNQGDIVVFDGRKWEVIQESTFSNNILNHYRYIAEYRGESEN